MSTGSRVFPAVRAEAVPRRMRDPHADLLRDTRPMTRDQAVARETWLGALALERKEELLFELEMILKGVVLWANPRLQPSRRGMPPLRDRDFRPHVAIVLEALARARTLCDRLLGAGRPNGSLPRTLPAGFTEAPRTDAAAVGAPLGPVESLAALRSGIVVASEIIGALGETDRLGHRVLFAALTALRRDIERNACFNPLSLLEFRPEFDRIRATEVLESLQLCESEASHRFAGVAFLAHFRLLRVAALLGAAASDASSLHRAWIFVPVLRAEADALRVLFRERAGAALADAQDRELLRLTAAEVRTRFEALAHETDQVSRTRAAATAAALALNATLRRGMEVVLAPAGAPVSDATLAAGFVDLAASVTDTLHHGLTRLVDVFRPGADPDRALNAPGARRGVFLQLRQWAWIFDLVTRAFVAKARLARQTSAERWADAPSHEFVGDFRRYFRELGQSLAYEVRYPYRDRLAHSLLALADVDLVDDATLDALVVECEALRAHLQSFVGEASDRPELRGVPLDKAVAGDLLRMHVASLPAAAPRPLDALPARS